jgi:hypothetical protein
MSAAGRRRGLSGRPGAGANRQRSSGDRLARLLTHVYHRRDPSVIWRATDELRVLVQTSEAWLAKAAGT